VVRQPRQSVVRRAPLTTGALKPRPQSLPGVCCGDTKQRQVTGRVGFDPSNLMPPQPRPRGQRSRSCACDCGCRYEGRDRSDLQQDMVLLSRGQLIGAGLEEPCGNTVSVTPPPTVDMLMIRPSTATRQVAGDNKADTSLGGHQEGARRYREATPSSPTPSLPIKHKPNRRTQASQRYGMSTALRRPCGSVIGECLARLLERVAHRFDGIVSSPARSSKA